MNEVIKTRRKELNITLEEIGDYVGVSKTTVQRWESGNISNMRRDRIKKLSEILRINPDELLGIEIKQEENFVRIPILSKVVAGVPATAQKEITGYEYVPSHWTENDSVFALEIKGDSMEPRIAQGDIVIVKEQKTVENGEIAVVAIGEETVCRKVVKHSDNIVLVSLNAKYEPMLFTIKDMEEKTVVIAGKVIELRAKF